MTAPNSPSLGVTHAAHKPLFEPDVVRRAFALLVATDGVAEIRALDATTRADRYSGIWFGYFTDAEALVTALAELRTAEGIYITLNPVNRALFARCANRLKKAGKKGGSASDDDIVRRHWLMIDCDPVRPSGISATDHEHRLADMRARIVRDELGAMGWPDPVLADSANGAHLLYRIDLPPDDDELIAKTLAALQKKFGDDPAKAEEAEGGVSVVIDVTTSNPARITKLYGTRGCKGDDIDERPHRLSRLIDVPDILIPLRQDQLISLIGETLASPASEASAVAPAKSSTASMGTFDLAAWIAKHGLNVRGPEDWSGRGGRAKRWVFVTCPWNAAHTDGGSYVGQFESGALFAGCHHNGCAGRDWHALRDVVEPAWRKTSADRTSCDTPSPIANTPTDDPVSDVLAFVDAPQGEEFLAAYERFPTDDLPPVVAAYVVEAAESLDCDPAYVIVPLLAAMASAIGNTRRIRLKRDWTEPAVIWSGVVGESGTVKSPALELATKPIWRRTRTILQEYQLVQGEYQEAYKEWKSLPKSERGEEPDPPPPCEHPLVSDITIEALADRLVATPRGTLVAIDELGAWFGSFNAYKARGGDVAHWLALHGARPLKVDRKTGDRKTIYIPHAAVCVTGTIQPATLRRQLTPEYFENGLAARILLAMPPTRVKQWTDREISEGTHAEMERLFDSLYGLRQSPGRGGTGEPVPIDLTPGAKVRWISFVNAHNIAMSDVSGDERAACAKLEGYAARFALLSHVIRQLSGHKVSDYVELEDVETGIALVTWFGEEARRVYTVLGEDDLSRQRRRLIAFVRSRGGSGSVRELSRSSRMFRTAAEWALALDDLVKIGAGRWQHPKPAVVGGRPTRIFHLLPPVDKSQNPDSGG